MCLAVLLSSAQPSILPLAVSGLVSGFSYPTARRNLSGASQGFAKIGPASASSSTNLRIALASKDIAGLERALLDVSHPSSANYRNHLSKTEVNALVAPSDEAAAAVQAWLASHGLVADTSMSAGHWLAVAVPVSKANGMLAANYETFVHVSSRKTYTRTLSFSEVADFIDHVHPTTAFNNPQSRGLALSIPQLAATMSSDGENSCATITPSMHSSASTSCLQSLYEIPTAAATESSNRIAVAGYINQFANNADLEAFLKAFRRDMNSSTTFTAQTFDGVRDPQDASDAGLEANLDIQYIVSLVTGIPVSFVSGGTKGQDPDLGGFLGIVNFLSGQDDVPQVLTTSYGENEAPLSRAFASVPRGVSVLWASGDGGVEGDSRVPGTSPEVASDFSSGGFSNYWGAPDYQADAVAAYLKAQGSTNKGLFNASGRGYPDVSAQGARVPIVLRGKTELVHSTVIGQLNDQLIVAGKSSLGFLNPWLYANPGMFNDVTKGNNPGCGADGFEARKEWDPSLLGLGTPNFTKMKAAAGL
ncbi:family S53 protease-like protein [Mycena latifolia]|nr:family S53 protease-like protein [Mycena latifolia]